jgi:hypothetical protein
MNDVAVLAAVSALVMLFVLAEIAAAVLPVIIVVALVPPEEREGLAKVIAACDSSRKLRVWPALRLAVTARRAERHQRVDANLNRHGDLNGAFARAADGQAAMNTPRSTAGSSAVDGAVRGADR